MLIVHNVSLSRILNNYIHTPTPSLVRSVREYVFYGFSGFKNMTFYVFWNDVSKNNVKSRKSIKFAEYL